MCPRPTITLALQMPRNRARGVASRAGALNHCWVLIRHRGAQPSIDSTAYVAPTATLVGDVRIGPRSRVMYGAVLDAEGSRVEVGEACVIAENAVLRATAVAGVDCPVQLADHVFVCPHATLLGCVVERCVYVATGATVLHGARLGAGCCVAVGALVHARTRVGEGVFIGPQTIAIGDPLRVLSADRQDEVAAAIQALNFASAAFGITSTWENRADRYEQAAEVRVAEFAAHAQDEIVAD